MVNEGRKGCKAKIAFKMKDNFVPESSSLKSLIMSKKEEEEPVLSCHSKNDDEQTETRNGEMTSERENKSNKYENPELECPAVPESSLNTNVQGNSKRKKKRKHRSASTHSNSSSNTQSGDDDDKVKARTSRKRRKVSKKSKKSHHHRHRSRKLDKGQVKKTKGQTPRESPKEKGTKSGTSLVGCCYHSCDDETDSEENGCCHDGKIPNIQLIRTDTTILSFHTNCDVPTVQKQELVNDVVTAVDGPVDIISFQMADDNDNDEGTHRDGKETSPSSNSIAIDCSNGKVEINLNGGRDSPYSSSSNSDSGSRSSVSSRSRRSSKSTSNHTGSRSNSSDYYRRRRRKRSRSRSKSFHSETDSRSSSSSSSISLRSRSPRSRSRSRSVPRIEPKDIPRRRGSPSFLDRRRITSARKRPVSYKRIDPWPVSDSSDSSF